MSIDTYDFNQLNYIREQIENMSKFNQIEILRILSNHKNTVALNENKYGIHVNLSEVNKNVLDELSLYVKYVNSQESNLNYIEQQKLDYKNTYFTKCIKDTTKN